MKINEKHVDDMSGAFIEAFKEAGRAYIAKHRESLTSVDVSAALITACAQLLAGSTVIGVFSEEETAKLFCEMFRDDCKALAAMPRPPKAPAKG